MEPVDLCDLLFEEKAIETHDHDKITETKRQLKQAKQLIETVKENENDCFHFFLFTLQRDEYEYIRKELEKPVSGALRDGMICSSIIVILVCFYLLKLTELRYA